MKNKKLMAVVFVSIAAFRIIGQANFMPPVTNWGDTVCGSGLSITVSNNFVAFGTNIILNCWIKNVSTNLVTAPMRVSSANFYITLTDASGTLRELTSDPDKIRRGSMIIGYILPGQTNSYPIPLSFGQDIKPGKYKLVARRKIVIEKKLYEIISNVLEIKVE